MTTVTLPKIEYQDLKRKAAMFERIVELAEEDSLFLPPSVRSRKQIIAGFRNTRKYKSAFIKSLRRGLKRSGYFRE
ncbi:MAG TPA: hypothetical protein VJC04_00380 [Candidatus Paceibacterota bacterium]